MSEMRFTIRPELVSDLLTALSLWILERRRQGQASPLWLLPLLHVIWVNTHLFVFGWAVLGVYTLDEGIRRRSLRTPLVAVSAASFAALFLNPYHYRAVLEPFLLVQRVGGGSIYAQSIRELAYGDFEAVTLPEHSDLEFGYARWRLTAEAGRTRVHISFSLRPAFWVPPVVGPLLINQALASEALALVRGIERVASEPRGGA